MDKRNYTQGVAHSLIYDTIRLSHIERLYQIYITKTCPCIIQQYFTAVKMFIFR